MIIFSPMELQAKPTIIHRDLSWLQFNDRVLDEANDPTNPLLERLKFLAISSSNLDEFFQIRFASVNRAISATFRQGREERARELEQTRQEILRAVQLLRNRQSLLLNELIPLLENEKIIIHRVDSVDTDARDLAKKIFDENILATTIQAEPYGIQPLRNLGNLTIAAIFPSGYGWAVPKGTPAAFVRLSPCGKIYLFFLDDLLTLFLGGTLNIKGDPIILRLTRDGDVPLDFEEEDSESVPDFIRKELKTRDRGRAVRLQYVLKQTDSDPKGQITAEPVLQKAAKVYNLSQEQVIQGPSTLCLHGVWGILNHFPEAFRKNSKLFYPPVFSTLPKILRKSRPAFSVLDRQDILLHHPYDSFDAFVEFVRDSCNDPSVTSIQMTIYRTDAVSPIIESLKKAAKTKRIRVFIELRARFDELNNLKLSESLKQAGVEVVFGFGKLKLHAKIALVERVKDGVTHYYSHLSTGNYNAATARQYTDIAVLTANPIVGEDANFFFNAVAQGQVPSSFRKFLSAPTRLHRRIHRYIEGETKAALSGKPARIFAKVNALVDESVIASLYRASNAGVKVDLVVRGACSLIPGVPGLSENIQVISIVDRLLEHSRIYYFENAKAAYISSADWMPRNFYSRLEIAYPILDPKLFLYIQETIIPTYFADTLKSSQLTSDGKWIKRTPGQKELAQRSQKRFEELALQEYKDTALE